MKVGSDYTTFVGKPVIITKDLRVGGNVYAKNIQNQVAVTVEEGNDPVYDEIEMKLVGRADMPTNMVGDSMYGVLIDGGASLMVTEGRIQTPSLWVTDDLHTNSMHTTDSIFVQGDVIITSGGVRFQGELMVDDTDHWIDMRQREIDNQTNGIEWALMYKTETPGERHDDNSIQVHLLGDSYVGTEKIMTKVQTDTTLTGDGTATSKLSVNSQTFATKAEVTAVEKEILWDYEKNIAPVLIGLFEEVETDTHKRLYITNAPPASEIPDGYHVIKWSFKEFLSSNDPHPAGSYFSDTVPGNLTEWNVKVCHFVPGFQDERFILIDQSITDPIKTIGWNPAVEPNPLLWLYNNGKIQRGCNDRLSADDTGN
jgi:hypothetical protein